MIQFQTNKSDLQQTRLIEISEPELDEGQVRLEVEHFSFTANNISYAVLGEKFAYWQFFPAFETNGELNTSWGIIPTWGYAKVSQSNCQDINTGESYFGYFPTASSVVMTPDHITEHGFIDSIAHRQQLPQGYNHYRRQPTSIEPRQQQEQMLLYPLLVTAFSLHDYLKANRWFNSKQIIVGSASSKTALGLAYALQDDADSPSVIGLTSQTNLESVNEIAIYDDVFSYAELEKLDTNKASAIVDMSANQALLIELQSLLGEQLTSCVNVGLTHWQDSAPNQDLSQSSVFFAPAQIQNYIEQHGQQAFNRDSQAFIQSTALKMRDWLTMREVAGLNGLQQHYSEVCDGSFPANQGLIISP